MTCVSQSIKYKSDPCYEKYEEDVEKYYNLDEKILSNNLTNYITQFYIQNHLTDIFPTRFQNVKIYVRNLYINYCKEYLTDKKITTEYIENLLLDDEEISYQVVQTVEKQVPYNITFLEYIEGCFNCINTLPIYSLYGVDQFDVYVYMAKLLDYAI